LSDLTGDEKRTLAGRPARYAHGALSAQHTANAERVRAMFANVTPFAPQTGRGAPAAATKPRRRCFTATQTVDEAYEMRLLGEVARWDDQAAFEEIYHRHRAAVARVALQICRDAASAEDVVQQTFTALWIRAERLIDKSVRLRPWLTTVARNAAIDQLRGHQSSQTLALAIDIPTSLPTPERAALTQDANAELMRAIATLPAGQRAALELVYLADMTYAAAAQTLGEPVGTIKSRVRLAIGQLRERLEHPAARV
jgi:RNA polymerase sigma-70 factor (ECF subfamily)